MAFTQFVHERWNNKSQVDVIYTDLEKAFDKVKHSQVIKCLIEMGVDMDLVSLIKSYLMGRKQYVEIRGACSQLYESTSGVPQGSNLGPLLFLIAVNGLTQIVSNSEMLYFADDFKLYGQIDSEEDIQLLKEDLLKVCEWCKINGFDLNVTKCVCMSFTLKKTPLQGNYEINKVALKRVNVQKDLGVTFDHRLSFTHHITSKITEAYRTMGFVIRSTRDFDIGVCLRLFDALVLPKLEYACVIWSPFYVTWKQSLENVQRKFLKYMFFKRYKIYPARGYEESKLLGEFNRLSLENRRMKTDILTLFKILKNYINSPEILQELPFAVRTVRTRGSNMYYLDCPRTNLYKSSPVYRMCDLFNTVINEVEWDMLNLREFNKIVTDKLFSLQSLK